MDNNGVLTATPEGKGFTLVPARMGELDSPASHTQLEHHHQPFTVGSEVEVSIDEEGFKGALFRATILKLPTTFPPTKKKNALIEYKTLVTEDGSSQLKEHVDIRSLRPLPPDIVDKDFEEGDIVDAVDKDGWWTGVVRKVLENARYNVFFENPLHAMDFQRNKLRLHQVWVDGKWVFPQKLDASILTNQLGISFEDGNILENVQPEILKNTETNIEKENSYSINSRNDLMEQPSFCDEISASFPLTLSKRRRSLSCKSRVSHPLKKLGKGNILETPAEDGLRKTERKALRGKSFGRKTTCNRGGRRRSFPSIRGDNGSESTDKFESPKGGEKARTKGCVDVKGELNKQGARFVNGNRGNTFRQSRWTQATDKEGKDDCDVLEIIAKEVSTRKEFEMNKHLASKAKWSTPAKNSLQLPNEVGVVEKNSNDQTKEKVIGVEPEQQQASKNSYKRKRGRPRKLLLVPKATGGEEQDGNGRNPEPIKSCISDRQVLKRKNWNELSMCKTKDDGNKRPSSSVDDDDRPLLMWLGGMQCSGSINSSRHTPDTAAKLRTKGREQVDVNELGVVDDHAPVKNQGWPFVKNSPVWKAIDSLEVLSLMPQTPHFRPLSAYKEECREGLAIGCMVTFASLVEKISKLQFDNPRCIFESMLASLCDLEQHGFDISMLCNRVNELLFIKDSQVRYEEETNEAENKILEHTQGKTKLAEEIEAIEQKIAELLKKQASIKVEMKTKDHEITTLQSHVEAIRDCTQNTRLHFEKQAALPLE